MASALAVGQAVVVLRRRQVHPRLDGHNMSQKLSMFISLVTLVLSEVIYVTYFSVQKNSSCEKHRPTSQKFRSSTSQTSTKSRDGTLVLKWKVYMPEQCGK